MIFYVFVFVAFVALYLYNTRTFNYWKDKGVKHEKPMIFFGTNAKNYLGRQSLTDSFAEAYWKFPAEKVVGILRSTVPCLVIRDPETVKRILTTDFSYFYNRGMNQHEEVVEPLLRNLFFADGDLWRLLRQRMTPAFTSGKLRAMFPLIVERAERLRARAMIAAEARRPIDARDLMARYTTDFIGACGFGLDANSLNEEDSVFRKLGVKIFNINPKHNLTVLLKDMFPELFKNFKLFGELEDEITDLVRAILKSRDWKPSGRNDFVDLLLECRNKGKLVGESIERKNPDGTPAVTSVELDDVLMTAQVFVFFAAGFETSSSSTSYTLHELAYNQDVQKKVHIEIDRVLAKHDNKLSYDSIQEMTYLEWTYNESLRKLAPLGFLIRKCTNRFTFSDMNITIDPGVRVCIPIQALHMDPKYFPEPEEFRPERFDPEVLTNEQKSVYMPFGIGPRACIGRRLGLMQSLAGLAAVLSTVSVEPAPRSRRRPPVDPSSILIQNLEGGIPLIFRARKSTIL